MNGTQRRYEPSGRGCGDDRNRGRCVQLGRGSDRIGLQGVSPVEPEKTKHDPIRALNVSCQGEATVPVSRVVPSGTAVGEVPRKRASPRAS